MPAVRDRPRVVLEPEIAQKPVEGQIRQTSVSTAFSKQKMADAPVPSATRPSRVPSEQDLWTQPEPDDQYADVVSASARTRSRYR